MKVCDNHHFKKKKTNKMNIQNAQQSVDNWIKNHGVRYLANTYKAIK